MRSLLALFFVAVLGSIIAPPTPAVAEEFRTVTASDAGPEEPYRLEEDFDDIPDGELPDGWNPAVGTWRVEDGRLVGGTTSETIDRLTFGEHRENFRFEATIQFRERANASRWTGLIVDIAPDGTVPWWHAVMRSGSTAGNGLEWATRTASNGWSVPTSTAAPFDVGLGNDVRFAVEVRGNRGILFLDGQEVLRYGGIERSDAGVLGFVLDRAVVEFDDIVVTDISPFEPLTRSGAALGAVARRGNSDAAPENTLAALEQAVRTNARFSIVDARLTADGDPVLMADETVDRTTDGTGPVGSLSTAEVTALDAGSSFSDAYAGQPVPTLAEALDLTDALVVDVRDDTAAAAAVAGMLDTRDAGPDTLVLVDDDTTAQAVRDASTEPLQLVLDLRGTTVVAAEVTDGPEDIRAVLLDPSTPADVIAALDDGGVGTILAAETPEEWLLADHNGAAFVASTAPGRMAGVLEGAAQDSLGFTDDGGPLVVAHRGWSRVAPENTLAAVASGIAAGADMVEIDAHSTLDDVAYVLHDQTLDRTTDRSGDLAAQTAAQVDGADAGSWFSPAYAEQDMPLLAQVLDLIDGSGTTLLLEVKGPEDLLEVSGMVDLIEARGMTDQVVLQSFSTDVLQHARSASDDLVLGLLTGGFGSDPVAQAQALDVAYFNPSWNSIAGDTGPVADLHAAGVRVVPYTVNSAADWDRMVRAGVDGAITDRAGDMVGWRDAHRLGIEPSVLVSLTAPTVDEGDTATSEASATVSIDRPLTAPVTLTVDTVDDTATAGEDYVALAGLDVTIPAGETQTSVPVTITGDDVVEGDETVTITVTAIDGATAEGCLPTASLTITNDDATELSTADVQVIEGDTGTTVAHVPVSLTAPADADVVFDVVAVPDTATLADDDYTAPAATGTVPAGTLSGTVELVINGDTGPEEDETVEVHLSNPTVATLGDAVSIVTIRNDDAAVRVADASVVEGDAPERATLAFALELDHPSAVDVEVAVATGATSGPGGATAGEDHTDVDTTVRIPAGHTSATVEVPVIGDDLDEDDETLLLVVTDPVDGDGTTVADPTATGTIVDDDVTIVSVDDAAATEGEDLSFTVRVDADPITAGLQPVPRDASVAWSSADGTATAGEDYTADGGSLQLPSGTTTATVLVPTATDTTDETDGETVMVTLADAIGVVISDGTGLGTILDPADTPDPGSGGGGSTPPTEPTDPSEPTDPEPTDPSEPLEPAEGGDDEVSRTHGATRVETAVNASRDHWPSASTRTNDLSGRAGGVVLARADAYPDALAGGALAASIDGPVLLTNGDALDPMVEEEIIRLGVEDVIVLGGDAAIGRGVEDRLVELGLDVERIAGTSRWDTAALVADRVGLPETGEVVVVLGDHPEPARAWPDALSAGALAASPDRLPVLLTAGSSVPAPTMDALEGLGARRVMLIGGPAVIDSEVEAALVGTVGEVVRLAGRDRYATSVAVARDAFARFADDPDGESIDIVFATGADYPDGLAAGAVAARRGGLVLLVPPSDLAEDSPALAFLRSIADRVDSGVVLGGPGAIDESTRALLEESIAG